MTGVRLTTDRGAEKVLGARGWRSALAVVVVCVMQFLTVFDGMTGALVRSFFAYDTAFRGGVTVAAADVNGDGTDDIITGAGPGGGPHVKVFDGASGALPQASTFGSA